MRDLERWYRHEAGYGSLLVSLVIDVAYWATFLYATFRIIR